MKDVACHWSVNVSEVEHVFARKRPVQRRTLFFRYSLSCFYLIDFYETGLNNLQLHMLEK